MQLLLPLAELVADARWRLGGQGGRPALEPSGFVFHLSRCGSTLIANSLQTAPKALVLSEPEIVAEVLARAPSLLKAVRKSNFGRPTPSTRCCQ